ncbi:hypothetical protein K501DRAFT_253465 [Backusella circina FSU 941]|nr:hypothetical protein K501DRAFT_253465 [Backusella circina FSU 941]
MDNASTTITTKDKSYLFGAQTNFFQSDPSIAAKSHESSPNAVPVLLTCSKTTRTTIGRGHDATVKIGKANKRVSREHVVIEHKPPHGYEMTVLSPNGALIDHIVFVEGEHVPLKEGTMIEILGTRLIFKGTKEEDDPMDIAEGEEGIEKEEEQIKDIVMSDKSNDNNKYKKNKIPVTTKKLMEEEEQQEKEKIKTNDKEQVVKKEEGVDSDDMPIENLKVPTKSPRNRKPKILEDEIIKVLVYTRKSTMSCKDILHRLEGELLENVFKVLTNSPGIGCIKRLGKTADGSPKEDLYYYKPDLDTDLERKSKYSDVGRSARKCTMKDTQYFFRIPPKLPHRPKANNQKRKSNNATPLKKSEEISDDSDDDIKSNSSGDVSDMEVYELFKDVQ